MDFNQKIEPLINSIAQLRKNAINISRVVIGDSLILEDLYFIASIDKCVRVIDGFIPLLQQRNLTCIGALLRM
ncbi:hypothetical protein SDC9_65286 [bioreactor metagenome]|uniref:Uncharacterized protein n=1 Tax=bioreactor metagenome TaxID=1076179 RepID=A0A644XS15_9ZZZZ